MKGNEGLNFTIHPQISNVYRHFRRKDEGMKGFSRFAFQIFNYLRIESCSLNETCPLTEN